MYHWASQGDAHNLKSMVNIPYTFLRIWQPCQTAHRSDTVLFEYVYCQDAHNLGGMQQMVCQCSLHWQTLVVF